MFSYFITKGPSKDLPDCFDFKQQHLRHVRFNERIPQQLVRCAKSLTFVRQILRHIVHHMDKRSQAKPGHPHQPVVPINNPKILDVTFDSMINTSTTLLRFGVPSLARLTSNSSNKTRMLLSGQSQVAMSSPLKNIFTRKPTSFLSRTIPRC